jgi:hypothetical protein
MTCNGWNPSTQASVRLVSPLKCSAASRFRDAARILRTDSSGGAGIRTPVRDKIDHSVYVRVPLIEVSSRWPMDSPLLDKSSKFLPTTGRRTSRLSRIFDTPKDASGGLQSGQVQQLLRVTQPGPSFGWQLKKFPEVLPGPEYLGTRPQLH